MLKKISYIGLATTLVLPNFSYASNNITFEELVNLHDPYQLENATNDRVLREGLIESSGMSETYETISLIYQDTGVAHMSKNGVEISILPVLDDSIASQYNSRSSFSENSDNNSEKTYDIITQTIDGGIRQAIIIYSADAPKGYEFDISLPDNFSLQKNMTGGIDILNEKGELHIAILAPWAKDSAGKEIKTWYEIKGKTLVQYVDFNKFNQFPLIADPSWCGDMISKVEWDSFLDVKYKKGMRVWPTACGRGSVFTGGGFYAESSWQEVLDKAPRSNMLWDLSYGTDTYWSMYYQYVCHANFANWKPTVGGDFFQGSWNLELDRPNVGYLKTIRAYCNPESDE